MSIAIGQGGTSMRGPLNIKRPLTSDQVQIYDATGQPTNGGVRYAKLAITAAQMLALHGTPLTVLAAPGAGQYIEVIDAKLVFTFGTTQYAAGSAVQLKLGTIVIATTTAALVNAVAANAALQLAFPGMGTAQTDGPDNTGLTLTAASTEFTTGDSPASLHVWYTPITG